MGPNARAGLGYGVARGLSSLGDMLAGMSAQRQAEARRLAEEKRNAANASRTFHNELQLEFGGRPDVQIGGEKPQSNVGMIGNKGMMAPWKKISLEAPDGGRVDIWKDVGYEARQAAEKEARLREIQAGAARTLGLPGAPQPGVDYTSLLGEKLKGQVAPKPQELVTLNLGDRSMRVPANEAGTWSRGRSPGTAEEAPDYGNYAAKRDKRRTDARTASLKLMDLDQALENGDIDPDTYKTQRAQVLRIYGFSSDYDMEQALKSSVPSSTPTLDDEGYWARLRAGG